MTTSVFVNCKLSAVSDKRRAGAAPGTPGSSSGCVTKLRRFRRNAPYSGGNGVPPSTTLNLRPSTHDPQLTASQLTAHSSQLTAARRRAAFSLIEVLVATTILMIIVVIISMVFQQTSGAYQSGTQRVKSQTVLRSIMGMIARDLTLAVDDLDYNGVENSFGRNTITFIALSGTPDAGSSTPDSKRTPQLIEYSYNGGLIKRTCTDLFCKRVDGKDTWGKASGSEAVKTTTLNPNQRLTDFFFEYTYPATDDGSDLPLRVDIQGEIETEGKATFVRGRSAGPDGIWGNADDIIIGDK